MNTCYTIITDLKGAQNYVSKDYRLLRAMEEKQVS